MEYLRSNAGFLSMPWALLGHSQYLNIPLIQIASVTGVYGISFLIVIVNTVLSEIIMNRSFELKPVITPIIIIVLTLFYGFAVISKGTPEYTDRITVIQPNIPQKIKWKREFRERNFNQHVTLTREAAEKDSPLLVVWPEGAALGSIRHNLSLSKTLTSLAKEINAYLVVGSSQIPKFGTGEFRKVNRLNSALLISPAGKIEKQYNKIYLLPFSEYLPYKDTIPWPKRFLHIGRYVPGTEYSIFNFNETKFSTLICWENIFPELVRQFVKKGAHFIINITNEAWFEETAAPYQLLSMSVFRAVENRVSVVRSANTGISGFIDPYGRITGKVQKYKKDIFVDGYLTKEIFVSQEKTLYTLYGDLFAYASIISAIVFLTLSFLKRY
jgi:apolipoprotein N-acyltransferase